MKNKTEIDMSEGALLPKLTLFILPLALSNILQIAFNTADLIVVGRCVGDAALAAVGSNNSLVSLLVCFIAGLTLGVGILVSRYFGAKDDEKLRETVGTSMVMIGIGSVAVALAGIAFSVPILRWTKVPTDVLPLAALYLKIYFAGFPALALYNCATAILRAVGDARRPLYYLTIAGILNVVLNLAFVLVFGWGVAGVGIATVVSELVSCVLTLRCLSRSTRAYRFEIRRLRVDRRSFVELLCVGIPAGIQGSLFSLSNVVVQGAVNSLGAAAMAGNSAGISIESFIYVAQDGIAQAATTSVGQNVGAGFYRRVKRAVFDCTILEIVLCTALASLAILFRRELTSLYTLDPEAIRAGETRLFVMGVVYCFCGLMSMCACALRGLGYAIFPTVVTFFCACVFRVVWIAVVFTRNPSLETIYVSYPISWIIACVALYIWYYLARRRGFNRLAPVAARVPENVRRSIFERLTKKNALKKQIAD